MHIVQTIIENKFDHDPIMQFILTAIDALGSQDLLFAHSASAQKEKSAAVGASS